MADFSREAKLIMPKKWVVLHRLRNHPNMKVNGRESVLILIALVKSYVKEKITHCGIFRICLVGLLK